VFGSQEIGQFCEVIIYSRRNVFPALSLRLTFQMGRLALCIAML
jgi:hypothetical protein